MTSISHAFPVRDGQKLISPDRKGRDTFSSTWRIAEATSLLKSTAQYDQWQALRQKNDDLALEMADMVIERHGLLENIRLGKEIDRAHFDALTKNLDKKGIHLFTADQMELPGQTPAAPGLPEIYAQTPASSSPGSLALETGTDSVVQSSSPEPSPPTSGNLSQEVILNVRAGNYILSPAFMGYDKSGNLFVPLEELARIIDFNIHTNMEQGESKGWFLSEDRRFHLNISSGQGMVDGREVQLEPGQFMAGDDDIFVDTKVLESWFPIGLSYDFSDQSLNLDPKEELPFQARLAREEGYQWGKGKTPYDAKLPLKPPEYSFMDPMFVDFGISGQYKDTDSTQNKETGSYYLLGKGDLGFMNSELYITGDEKERFTTTRLTLQREDPKGELLGPLKATSIGLGDVRIPSFPIVGGGKFERGATLGNLPLNITSEYDTTFFAGNLAPGWDVELYRNRVLLGNQRVGTEGRYDFDDVPLYYGNNEFTLKFYGPQGQEREEVKRINVGSNMIKPGEHQYQFSATQKDEKLYDPRQYVPKTADKESPRLIGRYRYGLSQNLSLQGGILSQKINDAPHDYLNIGAQGLFKEIYISGDYIHDLNGGDAIEALGQKKIGPMDIKIKQQFYHDFTREGETDKSNKIKSQTDISAFGSIDATQKTPQIPFSLNLKNTKRDTSEEQIFGARFSANVKETYINNYLQWRDDTKISEDYPTLEGGIQTTSQLGKFRLRTNLDYDFYPEAELSKAGVSGLYNLNRELSSEFTLTHDMGNNDLTTGTLGMNWNNGKFILSPSLSYNSDDDYGAFLSFSTSFGMEPRSKTPKFSSAREAGQGAVSAKVFLDNNNNKVFDHGDEPLEGAEIKAVQAYKTAATNADGIAFITGLRKNVPTDITLKTQSLEDPFWEPGKKGNSILPRPGHVETIDIPVITTGEIDGTLFMENKKGGKKSLNHAPLQLLNSSGEVIQQVKSEYDGFYLFMKIPPGDYSVRLDPDFEKNLGTSKMDPLSVTIGNDGTVVNGFDLVFMPKISIPLAVEPVPAPPQLEKALAPEKMKQTGHSARIAEKGSLKQHFGLHLSSYRTLDKAVAGIGFQKNKHKGLLDQAEFTIQKTDLGPEKGIWYRVVAGATDDKELLGSMQQAIQSTTGTTKVYARKITLGKKTGVHLSSTRTKENARLNILKLKADYPVLLKNQPFTIRTTDLGPGKGIWHRVIAGKFATPAQAETLATQIKSRVPYCQPRPIEKGSQFGVHTASYRTVYDAVQGLKNISTPLGTFDERLSIRRSDLGKKGIWYRVIMGQFDDQSDARNLAASLSQKGFYAEPMDFSSAGSL